MVEERLAEIDELRRVAVRLGRPTDRLDDAAAILRMREALGPNMSRLPDLPRRTIREYVALLERHADDLRIVAGGQPSALLTVVLPRLRRALEG
jgi:hypothetical protein